MDVVFDKYCVIRPAPAPDVIRPAPAPDVEYKATVISDFTFLETANKDTDKIVDAAVIFLGQADTIKYTIKKTGLNSCWLGGWTNDFC